MHPETQLAIMSALVGFLLKTSLGFCICWAIGKILVHPRKRFVAWFAFLLASCSYWLWLIGDFALRDLLPTPAHAPAPLAWSAPVGAVQLQVFWLSPAAILLRGFGVLYLIVLAYFLFARIKKHLHLRWILQFTYKPSDPVEAIFRPIAGSMDAGNVQLLMLSGIHSPATFGWLKPTILLPPLCLDQDESELKDIFRHELQHVRRRDFVFSAAASLCRSLLFFHPAAWYAMRRMRLESELACDLAVVGDSPERRATYAECLVRFARLHVAQEATPWNLDFAGSPVQLKVRIRSILAKTQPISRWMLALRLSFGLALLAGFLYAAPSLFIVLSCQQPPAVVREMSASPAVQPDLRSSGSKFRNSLRRSIAHGTKALPAPPADVPAAAPIQTAADTPPVIAPKLNPASRADPVLKRRGDTKAVTGLGYTPGSTILLSNPSSNSGNSLTRRASIASAVTAGASEAANIASHGRDKTGH